VTALLLLLALTQTCHANALLPDPRCTPGQATWDTLEVVCTQRTTNVRNVPEARKRAVLKSYGAHRGKAGDLEIDHLVPLELGGTNSQNNLWPQPAPLYHSKDRLENELHALVCAGEMELTQAQHDIETDWVALYVRVFGMQP